MDDLVEREGVYYKKFSDVPCTQKKTNQTAQPLKDAVLDCPYAEHVEDEQLQGTGRITTGAREGAWIKYHENGQLWSEGNTKDGRENGLWKEYYENGQLWVVKNFKDGNEIECEE